MVRLASHDPDDPEPLLNFGLDRMLKLSRFDLIAVFLLEGEHLIVKAARGPMADKRVRRHAIALADFPSIGAALNTGGPRVFNEEDHARGEGDPFDGILDFPHGHACMVIPMRFGNEPLGVISFDRVTCEAYENHFVQLMEIYAQILGMSLHQLEQNRLLRRAHREATERELLLSKENQPGVLLSPLDSRCSNVRLVGERLKQVAETDTPVLIMGETGTGKEGAAGMVHRWSRRCDKPLVKINCASIPENLLESELFGVVKGAYTDAVRDRPGRFRMANTGTLFLDEIGDLSPALQAKLLRVLQEGTFEPVGSDRTVKVDVRILAATNADLHRACEERRFREDLYYRLSVFPVTLAALRERMDDLQPLCEALLKGLAKRLGKSGLYLAEDAYARLQAYAWPGNIRELANVLERAAILAGGNVLTADLFDLKTRRAPNAFTEPESNSMLEEFTSLEEVQRRHIIRTLNRCGGKLYGPEGAAERLGLKPSTLQSRMKKMGIQRTIDFSGA
ncbi:MAG: sigma 54-interacting transcriptional regulator [Acidobacteriota bacterium]|nr:sigma 54-interacting transcriptional regulator [Acidobacteriota bacterium]